MVTNNAWNSEDPAQVAKGGTGAATLTGVLTGNGTSAVTANAVTQYGTVVAGASNAVSSVAPSATTGVPLISQGASANPAYGTAVVAGGGTGLAATTAYAVLCGGTTTTAALQPIAGVGTAAQVLTSNGAGALPTFQAAGGGGGIALQQVSTNYVTHTTSSTAIPLDDTIPQNTEGVEIMTVTITPNNSSNILLIKANIWGTAAAIRVGSMALFQDTTAGALAAAVCGSDAVESWLNGVLVYRMAAGTVSATTFKIRVGPNAGSLYINGSSGSRMFGGVGNCTMEVIEYEV